jgi:hypothetical protein
MEIQRLIAMRGPMSYCRPCQKQAQEDEVLLVPPLKYVVDVSLRICRAERILIYHTVTELYSIVKSFA